MSPGPNAEVGVPKLMFTTLAPRSTDCFTPQLMSGAEPTPTRSGRPGNWADPSTLIGRSPQAPPRPGGTRWPAAATMPAAAVPCPTSSLGS
jgi:hypothetical protein